MDVVRRILGSSGGPTWNAKKVAHSRVEWRNNWWCNCGASVSAETQRWWFVRRRFPWPKDHSIPKNIGFIILCKLMTHVVHRWENVVKLVLQLPFPGILYVMETIGLMRSRAVCMTVKRGDILGYLGRYSWLSIKFRNLSLMVIVPLTHWLMTSPLGACAWKKKCYRLMGVSDLSLRKKPCSFKSVLANWHVDRFSW